MDHRIGRVVFALLVGLLVALLSYQWISNPERRAERALQELVVTSAREHLKSVVGGESLEIVDPLSPNRKVGKVYVFAEGENWAVSGHYRRGEDDRWHPFLMTLASDQSIRSLKIKDRDQQLIERAGSDPLLEISP